AAAADVEEDEEEVLELTDALADDGHVESVGSDGGDVLASIDNTLESLEDEEEEELAPAPAPMPRAVPRAQPAADLGEGLLSAAAVAASTEALKALRAPQDLGTLPFISGNTVEGLVQVM